MKTLFKFSIQSVSDIITNSSSELFVFKNSSKEHVIELLDSIHPNWRDEYCEPEPLKDACDYIIREYLPDEYGLDCYEQLLSKYKNKDETPQFKFIKSYGLTPEEVFVNWDKWDPNLGMFESDENKTSELIWRDDAYDLIRSKMTENEWMITSKRDNPDWDYQEKLMEVAARFHLG